MRFEPTKPAPPVITMKFFINECLAMSYSSVP